VLLARPCYRSVFFFDPRHGHQRGSVDRSDLHPDNRRAKGTWRCSFRLHACDTSPCACLQAVTSEFKRQFEHNLEADIRSETGGDLEKVLCLRLNAAEEKGDMDRDVKVLYEAGQGKIGTDEGVFISLLTARSPYVRFSRFALCGSGPWCF